MDDQRVVPTADWVRHFRKAIFDGGHYDWRDGKRCVPQPGTEVRFLNGESEVDVLICLECDMISIAPLGKTCWADFDLRIDRSAAWGKERISVAHGEYERLIDDAFQGKSTSR